MKYVRADTGAKTGTLTETNLCDNKQTTNERTNLVNHDDAIQTNTTYITCRTQHI